MKQILHIFAKDARHLWAEILLSVAVIVAFASADRADWMTGDTIHSYVAHAVRYPSGWAQIFVNILYLLVVISWWLLISNLIHDEKLVGDRQFWLTRPYEWKKLLAAKMFFLLVFLYLPLLIVQCALLVSAGFSPFSHFPALLFNLFLISGLIVLPLVAIAAVTPNLARMTLVLLGILLAVVSLLALASSVDLEAMALPWEMAAYFALLICLCIAAVVSQYATRKTRTSVLLLAAFPILFFTVGEFIAPSQLLVDHSYPLSTATDAPVQLSYSPSALSEPVTYVARVSREVGIQTSLHVSGIANHSVVIPNAVRATFESPNGTRWNSAWQSIYLTRLSPADKTVRVGFSMPLALYDRLKSAPLTLHLTLAVTQAQVGRVTNLSLPEDAFSVPDFGVCSPQGGLEDPNEIPGISCLSAVREPPLTQIQLVAQNASSTCATAQTNAGVPTAIWQGALDAWPAQIGISSVKFFYGAYPDQVHLCRGAPITFTRYDLARRAQVGITIAGFQLPALTAGQRSVIMNP